VPRTKKGEEILWEENQARKVKERDIERGFWKRQGVSTNSPALVDSRIRLPSETIKKILSYFGTRKYKSTRGYSVEWIAKKIMEEDKREAIEILKVWTHRSRREEYIIDKVQELNEMTDDEVIIALKALEKPHILQKLGDKQLDVRVKLTTTDTRKMFYKKVLIDLGYSSLYISQKFIKENHLKIHKLSLPITCYNADGSTNKNGSITEMIEMCMSIGDHKELIQLSVTNIGNL